MPTPKRYKLGNLIFDDMFKSIDNIGKVAYRTNGQIISTTVLYEDELIKMGAQELPEEGEIEELDWFKENNKCMPGEEMLIGDTDKVIEEKLNEVIRIVNQLRREKRA